MNTKLSRIQLDCASQLRKASTEAKAVARYFDQAVIEAKQEARTHCLMNEAE